MILSRAVPLAVCETVDGLDDVMAPIAVGSVTALHAGERVDQGLDVLIGQVGQPGDRWATSAGSVGPVMVVLMDPAGQRLPAV